MKQAKTPLTRLNFVRKIRKKLRKEMEERWKHRKALSAIKQTKNKGKKMKVKTYTLISPKGKKYKTDNLTKFANRFPSLTRTGLSKIVNGHQSMHKNWRVA